MQKLRNLLYLATLLCLGSTHADAQESVRTSISSIQSSVVYRISADRVTEDAPAVDGRLDEAAWTGVHDGMQFTQRAPRSGLPSGQLTGVQVLYDESSVYFGMRMFDSAPDSIRSRLVRRDTQVEGSDWAHVYVDSYNDSRSAFRFSVNPRGVLVDALHFADTEEDVEWNAVWEAAVQTDSLGWTAEFRVPISQLRFNPKRQGGMEWGINFGREIARTGEQTFWTPIDAEAAGFVSEFGTLDGLVGLSSPSRLEIRPYTLSRLTRGPGANNNPFYHSNDLGTSVGVDMRYGITSDATVSLTINPDFGQVESDPSVVNLSAFETFLPEKRQFFLEGADMFRVTYPYFPQVVYSRRVGRTPTGSPPGDIAFTDELEPTTILGAAKLTAKTQGGLSVGAMTAWTGAESQRFVLEDGSTGSAVVEPAATYTAARVIQDLRDGASAIGAIGTLTKRRLDAEHRSRLHSTAATGGIDLRHRLSGGNYELKGSFIGSRVTGSPEAIAWTQRAPGRDFERPDADHLTFDSLRTSLDGIQTGLSFGRVGGGHWRWSLAGSLMSPGFEVNDLGFQNGADQASATATAMYLETHPMGPFRRWDLSVYHTSAWTTGGELKWGWSQVYGSAEFRNQWSINFGVDRTYPSLSTEMLRGGPALRRPGYVSTWLGFSGDPRSPVVLGGSSWIRHDDEGAGNTFQIQPSLTFRPVPSLSLSLQPRYMSRRDAAEYVTTFEADNDPVFVVGRLRQTTVSLTTRLNYTFSPTLSLEFYAQPFISRARYDGFRQVVDAHGRTEGERYATLGAEFEAPDRDFNFKQLRSNLVLRWEYLPGSTVFLVWGQDRSDREGTGTFDVWRDTQRLFQIDGTNVFLIKVNYWLSR